MNHRRIVFAIYGTGLAAPFVWLGCQGNVLDLGTNDAGAVMTGSSEDGGVEDDAGPEQVWTGYVENYTFPSGSDAVTLTFSVADTGAVTGHVLFGDLPLFPPPTDPNVGYPYPDVDANTEELGVLEGFEFTLRAATLIANRFQAGYATQELQAQWCTLQMPHLYSPPDTYNCIYGVSTMFASAGCSLTFADGGSQAVNCGKLEICKNLDICSCDASACGTVVPPATIAETGFDLQVDGTHADGTLLVGGGSQNVHLTRQQ